MKKFNKIIIGIFIVICIFLVLILSFGILQRCTGSVNIDEKSVAALNRLQNIEKSEALAFNKMLFNTIPGEKNPSEHYNEKIYETTEFKRITSFEIDDSGSRMVLNYSFKDIPFASCEVCISTDSASYVTYSSIEELKEKLSEDITFNKYMYNKYVIQDTVGNIDYFISPITTPPRANCFYLFVTDRNERVIDSVYEIGEYFVSIHEYLPPNSQAKYMIVLQDVGLLLRNAEDSSVCA